MCRLSCSSFSFTPSPTKSKLVDDSAAAEVKGWDLFSGQGMPRNGLSARRCHFRFEALFYLIWFWFPLPRW
jgi:hypothetical protein